MTSINTLKAGIFISLIATGFLSSEFVKVPKTFFIQIEGNSIMGRTDWEISRLRDPETGKIPDGIRKKELDFSKTIPGFNNENKLATLTWEPRGPWNVGGRTRAFAVDIANPNKLLAGSTSGGMWLSNNAGTNWTQHWNEIHQSISCIAQDARVGKTNTWYIGTGEGYGQSASSTGAFYLGNGMYKSMDGGITWNSLASTVSGTPQTFDNIWDIIWNVATNPADLTNDVVYAATYGGIFKSVNGGNTWTVAKGNASPYSYFSDVAVTPSGAVYATLSEETFSNPPASGAQKGIWRSSDGLNWTNITPAGFPTKYGRVKIGISPSDENQVYFFAGTTTGFGTPDTNFVGDVEWNSLWKYDYDTLASSWLDLSANLPTTGGLFDKQSTQGGYNMIVKIHPTDTAIVFLGGTNLYRSTSGFFTPDSTKFIGGYQQGATLPIVNNYLNHHPDQHEVVFDPSNPNIMYSANDGGIFKTTNNAATTVAWTPLNNGYLTSMFYTVALDPKSPNDSTIIGGTQDNGSWFVNSKNSQANWVSPRGGDGSYCAIANNKAFYYLSIQNGKMMKATLGAAGAVQTFARIDPIGGKGYQFINPYVLDPNDNNVMYLAGGKNLWRNDALNSIPMSGNWDTISTGWTMFTDTVPIANAKITAVAVSKNPANTVYYGTSSKNIYRLDNANTGIPVPVNITGNTSPNNFPNGGNVSCIAIDPLDAGNVMVAFSNYNVYSIYYSSNADSIAPTWTKVAGNLEQNSSGTGNGSSVRWISILPVSDGIVYLAATSTGLYTTTFLNGTSTLWAQQGSSTIGNSICDMIDARTLDGFVAVATHSQGIFTSKITSINDVLSKPEVELPNFYLAVYPNPVSNAATIQFTTQRNEQIKINLFDLNGKLVQTVVDQTFAQGNHRINISSNLLSTGTYYCILKAGAYTETKKIIILK